MLNISPSGLSDFKKSPLMFWLKHHHQIEIPRGAFPSLPGGMDRVLKTHYDRARAAGSLPFEIKGKVHGILFQDQALLKKWRFYKTGLQATVRPGLTIGGALDDLVFDPHNQMHSVLDYKTRGAKWKPGATEEYYGTQGDCYDLMLNVNDYKTNGQAHFVYYWPLKDGVVNDSGDSQAGVIFETDVVTIEVRGQRAAELAIKAQECVEGPMPQLNSENEVDAFLIAVREKVNPELSEV